MIRCEPTGAKVGGLSLALVKALSKDKKAQEIKKKCNNLTLRSIIKCFLTNKVT